MFGARIDFAETSRHKNGIRSRIGTRIGIQHRRYNVASVLPAVMNFIKNPVDNKTEFLADSRILFIDGKLVSARKNRHAEMIFDEFQIAVIRSTYAGKYICIRNDYRIFRFHKSSI